MREYHLIEPVYNQDSRILILGSFPSVKSRAGNFFYHHPQNRFWKILSSKITHIYTNGNLADKLYHQYFDNKISLPVTKLPSSSPANATYSLDKLINCWNVIKIDE